MSIKRTWISLLVMLLALVANAQKLSPTTNVTLGGSLTNSHLTMEYSIGEPVINTYSSTGNEISCGFEQPEMNIARVPARGSYYVGAPVSILYIAKGVFGPSNVFTAQLSDSLGMFNSSVTNITPIIYSHAGLDSIWVSLSDSMLHGLQYKIRLISTSPPDTTIPGKVIVPLQVNVSISPATCTGSGTVSLTAENGITPYKYLWSNGNTNATISGLSAGIYTCTVTDSVNRSRIIYANVGYQVNWDTLNLVHDSIGILTSLSTDPLSNGYATTASTLYKGTDGWVQFVVAPGDSVKADLELVNNNSIAGIFEGTKIRILPDSIIVVVQTTDTFYSVFLGKYLAGEGYVFIISTSGDSIYVSQSDLSDRLLVKYGFYTHRPFTLSPKIENFKINSTLYSVASSFGCNNALHVATQVVNKSDQHLGAIYLTPYGGVAPYSYRWKDIDSTHGIQMNLDSFVMQFSSLGLDTTGYHAQFSNVNTSNTSNHVGIDTGLYVVTITDSRDSILVDSIRIGNVVNLAVTPGSLVDSIGIVTKISGINSWVDNAAISVSPTDTGGNGFFEFQVLDTGSFDFGFRDLSSNILTDSIASFQNLNYLAHEYYWIRITNQTVIYSSNSMPPIGVSFINPNDVIGIYLNGSQVVIKKNCQIVFASTRSIPGIYSLFTVARIFSQHSAFRIIQDIFY